MPVSDADRELMKAVFVTIGWPQRASIFDGGTFADGLAEEGLLLVAAHREQAERDALERARIAISHLDSDVETIHGGKAIYIKRGDAMQAIRALKP